MIMCMNKAFSLLLNLSLYERRFEVIFSVGFLQYFVKVLILVEYLFTLFYIVVIDFSKLYVNLYGPKRSSRSRIIHVCLDICVHV